MVKILGLCALSTLILVSCKRAQQESSGSISIQIPSVQQFKASQTKSQAMTASAIDYSLLCFTVNVKAPPDIPSIPATACKIERGLLADQSVPAGGTLSISVPTGSGRVFEVYGFLRSSTAEACPSTSPDWNWPIQKTYFLGSSKADITKDIENVSISISLPQDTQNLAVANNWPLTCGGVTLATSSLGHVVVGAQSLSSASFQMRARVTEKNLEKILVSTPSGWTLKGRINDQ